MLLLVLLLLLSGEVGLVGNVGGESDGQHLEMVGLFQPGGHRGRTDRAGEERDEGDRGPPNDSRDGMADTSA